MDRVSFAFRNGRTLLCGAASLTLAVGCGPGFDDGHTDVEHEGLGEREGAAPSQVPATKREDGASLTYYQHTSFDADEQLLDGVVWGELDEPTRQRVARPYRHLHEAVVFEEIARDGVDEDGIRSNEYAVWAHDNVRPAELPRWSGPAYYTRAASELVDRDWAEGERHTVTLGIRDFPEWDVPLPPDPTFTSDADVKALIEAREAAIAARSEAFLMATSELRAFLDAAGAKVEAMGDKGAWIAATVDHETFLGLGARDDVSTIALEEGGVESGWPVGRSGTAARMDSQVFVDNGYDGAADSGRSNDTGYTRMMIAVIDNGIQSDARFLCDFLGTPGLCTSSRLAEMFTCDDPDGDGNYCEPVTTFPANGDNGFGWAHGTSVAALAVADFTAGQGDGQRLGDPSWTNNFCTYDSDCASGSCSYVNRCEHDPTWEQDATGISPRAKLVFFGHSNPLTGPALGQADAFDDAVDRHVDIISISQGNLAQRCDPVADSATEKEAEVAYDDGIFIAACGGNAGQPSASDCAPSGPCNTWSPGSLAKSFAVVGLDSLASGCDADYHTACPLSNGSSCPGGADVKLESSGGGSGVYLGAASLVDIVAPARLSHNYQAEDTSQSPTVPEEVLETGSAGGCSSATPVLAGAAANVKDFQISIGNTWINYPGRLHAMMLAMGDRAASTTGKLSSSSHDRWGMGRAKLRYLGSGGISPNAGLTWTTSLTRGGSDAVTTLRTTPLTSSFVFAKCVTFQHEDFSNDTTYPTISDIDLVVRVRQPVSGACVAGAGTIMATYDDHSLDWKRMVRIFASSVSGGFTGRCIDVTLVNDNVEPDGETVTVRCWTGGEDDAS